MANTDLVCWLVAGCLSAMPAASAVAEDDLLRAGKRQFLHCVGCHSLDANARPKLGPHLAGIVNRPVAAVPGYAYSSALAGQSFVWSEAQLNLWLEKPQAQVPEMCMPFKGLAKPEARQALIFYLREAVP